MHICTYIYVYIFVYLFIYESVNIWHKGETQWVKNIEAKH